MSAAPAPASDAPVVIVGGGISGLSLAHFLTQAGVPSLLVERAARLGGNIRTEAHDGFLYDCGPDSFLRTKVEGRALAESLELGAELISPLPGASRVYVARDGVLFPMPEGLALGFPTRPGSLLTTPLLSGVGKLRALLEPFVPPRGVWPHDEETIADFARRRVGQEMGERLVAPLLAGVFAGDPERLSMAATFPQLLELEQRHGSLFSGMTGGRPLLAALRRPRSQVPSPFLSLRRGLGSLVDALAARLPEGSVRLGTEVLRVLPAGAVGPGLGVELPSGERLAAQSVVLAGPPWGAAELVESLDPELSRELGSVRGEPTATVFFGLDPAALDRPLDGSGFIVPPGEGELLAATFTSSKWEGRAPRGAALVRGFLGGARGLSIEGKSDDALERQAYRELSRFMGALGTPLFTRVYRYARGTPQPEVGHADRLARIAARTAGLPGLELLGPGYGGVGIPDCIRQARELAARLGG